MIDRQLDVPILRYMLNQSHELDMMFRALADPARRTIVDRLCRGPASVSELAAPLSMSLPSVMQHLQMLEASGLVRSEKTGRVRVCRIDPAALSSAERWINDRRRHWERSLDRLGDYLKATADTPEMPSESLETGKPDLKEEDHDGP